jgi:uncharacterized cupredoxin-like copper-binding protein
MSGRWGGVALAGLLLLASALLAGGCTVAARGAQRVEIRIHYSSFHPSSLTVAHGVPVTFVLVNEDPIDHEWLIGDASFHERHRHGTEAHHDARPNEVSIRALETVETTITFEEPGTFRYICHLPGHEAYGMVGTLTVT